MPFINLKYIQYNVIVYYTLTKRIREITDHAKLYIKPYLFRTKSY